MKTILLTKGQVALVDDEDYALLSGHTWSSRKDPNTFYAYRHERVSCNVWRMVQMHTEILRIISIPGMVVDHIDGNGLNNQKSNLRQCTYAQNKQNSRKRKRTSSQFKGVNFHKGGQNWQAYITVNKKRIWLGRFNSEIEAASIYDAKARECFGEYAVTNFNLIGGKK